MRPELATSSCIVPLCRASRTSVRRWPGMKVSAMAAAAAAGQHEVELADTPAKPEDYIRRRGLRLVKPYYFDFLCSVKNRWKGMTVVDVLSSEFPARPRSYYEQAFADGRIRVEKRKGVEATTPLDGREQLRHFVHRHEPPVLDLPIEVIAETDELVAVTKPASIPVHVAGQYRKNTVLAILQMSRPDLGSLHPVHRLDKPVSGLLLFAKSAKAAEGVRAQLTNRQDVEKVYLARVVGTFPAGRIKVHAALAWDARTNHTFVTSITALGAIQDTAAHPAAPADGQQRQQREATVDGDWAAQPAADMLPAGQSAEGSAFQGAPAAAQGRGVPASSMADGRVSEACPTGAPGQNSPASGMAMPPAGGNLLAAPNLEELQKYGLHSGGDELSAEDLERRKTVQGKDAVTEFRLLGAAPDGLTSVVQCRPLTGRTHQLRVHLQLLGHPIANDEQYGGTYPGPTQVKMRGRWERETEGRPTNEQPAKRQRCEADSPAAAASNHTCSSAEEPAKQQADSSPGMQPDEVVDFARLQAVGSLGVKPDEFVVPEQLTDGLCWQCPWLVPDGYPTELVPMWLHAHRYSTPDWTFESPAPHWASLDWTPRSRLNDIKNLLKEDL